jgi:hypothetical protein
MQTYHVAVYATTEYGNGKTENQNEIVNVRANSLAEAQEKAETRYGIQHPNADEWAATHWFNTETRKWVEFD